MSHLTFRVQPEDEKHIETLCQNLKLNRSEAIRFALSTVVSFLNEPPSKRKLGSFIGSSEGPSDLSRNKRAYLKDKLKKKHARKRDR